MLLAKDTRVCKQRGRNAPQTKEQPMSVLFCGIDFHKRTSTIVVINKNNQQVGSTKRVSSDRLIEELVQLNNPIVGIECSGGVNHVVDKIKALGIDVRIINSNKARAIGYAGKKSDPKDALMIAQLLRSDFAPEVSHRSRQTRNMSMLITAREHLVSSRTQSICHIRGLLREYGLVMKAGVHSFFKEAPGQLRLLEKQNAMLASTLMQTFELCNQLKMQEEEINAQIEQTTNEDPKIKKLRDIPGVGLLGAYLMVAVIDDISRFKDSKAFASYLGLVPRENSSGDKRRLGSVTKAGNETLRRYLIHGARSLLNSKRYQNDRMYRWAKNIERKRGTNKATVALAHKLARISFALLRDDENYATSQKKKTA